MSSPQQPAAEQGHTEAEPRRSAEELRVEGEERRAARREAPRTGALPAEQAAALDELAQRSDVDADAEEAGPQPREGAGAGAGEGATVRVEAEPTEERAEQQSFPTLREG